MLSLPYAVHKSTSMPLAVNSESVLDGHFKLKPDATIDKEYAPGFVIAIKID
jgi:hypothetical protein